MRIKIARHGCLELERAGELKAQYCPYDSNDQRARCGDGCPKFKEDTECVVLGETASLFKSVNCCGTEWKCDEKDFTDEREVSP